MPGKVKVRILAGRNLPVMDRASETCDAFVEMKLGNTTYKTEVFRHSLNPQWNSEWFRFEVDDEELQDEPLQIRVMDYDTYSANDAIGKVYIDLNPLLCKEAGSVMAGWFPIFDTMHGIRGEINVMVKVHLFSDSNKYRESSCGVRFFYGSSIPHGYRAQEILGFVEELVVNDDPEYQWIDKIRTPRASNEARQTLFSKLSGEVQRKIGLKALELGGNAVIGYHQCFDLEGESGIVVRGIGTAVILNRLSETNPQASSPPKESGRESPLLEDGISSSAHGPGSPTGAAAAAPSKVMQSPAKAGVLCATRRSSESDLSTPPKGNSLGDSGGSGSGGTRSSIQRPTVAQESLSMLEYPFITMKQFPLGLIQHIGGVVSARSVKLLVQINNPDEPETRDAWWTELRKEVRSHIRALGCNVVLGYMETTSISDDICILSASGTAAVLSVTETDSIGNTPLLGMGLQPRPSLVTTAPNVERKECDREKDKDVLAKDKEKPLKIDINLANQMRQAQLADWGDDVSNAPACGICHIPYSESSVPFPVSLVRCSICRKSKVPDVLFMTIEPPPNIPTTGKGCLLQARVCKGKKDGRGEQNAKEISDSLPFLEYELHRQLLNKLKVKGMNVIFGLKVQVSVGDKLIIGIATGTGTFVSALPPPNIPKITCGKSDNNLKMAEIQKRIQDAVSKNKECYGIRAAAFEPVPESHLNGKSEDGDSSDDEEHPDIDLSSGNKDACILEVDDAEDVDIISQLIDPKTPEGFEMCNTEILPGVENFMCSLQMFTRVFRTKLSGGPNSSHISQTFEEVIQSLFVKLRRLVPCCLTNLDFQVDLVEQDEMQVSVLGVAVGLGDSSLLTTVGHASMKQRPKPSGEDRSSDLIFQMDEEKSDHLHSTGQKRHATQHTSEKKFFNDLVGEPFGIEITPLSFIPGRKIERYVGDLDFFFIRESTSIRESGGLNGFIQSFVTEMLAIVRAHVAALGGNAVVSFHMTQCILIYNPHKNQGQCLINVAGDAVCVQLLYSQSGDGDLGKIVHSDAD